MSGPPRWSVLAHDSGGLEAAGLTPATAAAATLATFALAVIGLRSTWTDARLAPTPDGCTTSADRDGDRLGGPGATGAGVVLARVVLLAVAGLLLLVGFTGNPTTGANPVPLAVYSVFWYGGVLLAAVIGDWWTATNPAVALVAPFDRGRRPSGDRDAATWWLPAALLFGFAVCWLCWPDGLRPRQSASVVAVWLVAMTAGGAARGSAWIRSHDPFGVLFTAVGACSPVRWREGRPRWTQPGHHLASRTARADRTTAAVLAVALGAIAFDGMQVTTAWARLVGTRSLGELAVVNTLALTWCIAAVAAAWVGAARWAARSAAPGVGSASTLAVGLAPALAAVVAVGRLGHDLGRFLAGLQNSAALASDPFANGADLFGTVDWIDQQVLAPAVLGWVGVLLLLAGHLLALVVVHDRCVARLGAEGAVLASTPFVAFLAASLVLSMLLLAP